MYSKKITFLLAGLFLFQTANSQTADIVLLNGKIFTAEPSQLWVEALAINGNTIFTADSVKPFVEAVAIRGERIIAVGSSAEVEKLSGTNTRRIDLQGQVVTPGFNDAHIHFGIDPTGFNLQFRTMDPNWEETSDAIKAATKQVPEESWIFGYIGPGVVLDEEVTRFSLDRIAPNHPVLLRAYYGHGYIVNTKAMPLLRIAEEEPDPIGGRFERVADSNRINGRLWGYAAWRLNRILSEMVSDEEAVNRLRQLADEALKHGVTSMQMFSTLSIDRFTQLLVKADLPIRVHARPFSLTSSKERDLTEFLQLSKLSIPNSNVSVSGIKWVLDGTPFEHGAALRNSYNDRTDWCGKLNFEKSDIDDIVKESLEYKQPLLVHCAGDKCAETVFNALESYGTEVNWSEKRVRIEHGDGVISNLISRARNLGVVVVQNPTHFSDPELFHQRWGTEMQPLRSLIEAEIPVALGSDGAMNPFLNIMFATIHPYNPKEAITREQAVRAYTYGSAFAEFAETEKGLIAKGMLADLVVLSQDIFVAPIPELPKTSSVLTIVGGQIVHDANMYSGIETSEN